MANPTIHCQLMSRAVLVFCSVVFPLITGGEVESESLCHCGASFSVAALVIVICALLRCSSNCLFLRF
jgi:hypothetical protein